MNEVRKMSQPALPFQDLTIPTPSASRRARLCQVQRALSKLRQLHEELNEALYTASANERPSIHSPADAAELIAPFIANLDHEELWTLLLNTRNQVLKLVKNYQGTVNASQVRVAELFKPAVVENAPAIIIAHNHPSGAPQPSPDDVAVTRSIVQAGKLLDVNVLDHVIIGHDGRHISLKERGLGFS